VKGTRKELKPWLSAKDGGCPSPPGAPCEVMEGWAMLSPAHNDAGLVLEAEKRGAHQAARGGKA